MPMGYARAAKSRLPANETTYECQSNFWRAGNFSCPARTASSSVSFRELRRKLKELHDNAPLQLPGASGQTNLHSEG
jgi:hypothetical protein